MGQILRISHIETTYEPGALAQDTIWSTDVEDLAIRQLRGWVEESLRLTHCTAAHNLLVVLNSAVRGQAFDRGKADALEHGESKLSDHATPIWKSGYEPGFAEGMSIRAGEL